MLEKSNDNNMVYKNLQNNSTENFLTSFSVLQIFQFKLTTMKFKELKRQNTSTKSLQLFS